MSRKQIKGGKADKMSIEDIAKKHDVSVESIKTQIDMGKKVELEHVDDEGLAEDIAMDHLEEIPDYYTRLKKMEKEAKKELNTESDRFRALAGIKEGDKKFLTNESFEEPIPMPKVVAIKNKETGEWESLDENKKDDDFIVLEFEQEEVEPGKDDDELYKLKQ